MNVLLLGSGGREHAIAWKIYQSSLSSKLYVAPGNAGTDILATNVDLDPMDFPSIGRFIRKHEINMLIVGPEAPLVEGIIDFFQDSDKFEGLVTIGPRKAGAMLEGSKDFAKAFMARHNIPTADYATFKSNDIKKAKAYLDQRTPPYVIKADGLAAGKGVIITSDREEKMDFSKQLLKSVLETITIIKQEERVGKLVESKSTPKGSLLLVERIFDIKNFISALM